MNKYVASLIVLGLLGFYGLKELKKTYQDFSTDEVVEIPANIPEVSIKPGQGEVIYNIEVDRFVDADQDNNIGLDLADTLGWHGGDLQGVISKLDYIKDLGATAILLNPLTKQRDDKQVLKLKSGETREIAPFTGMDTQDPAKFSPHFGRFQDLLDLSIKAHEKGLRVYISMDLNAVSADSPLPSRPEMGTFFRMPGEAPECDPKQKYATECVLAGQPDFLQELPEVQSYLYDVVKEKWARLGVDGIFFETVFAYNQDFLKNIAKNLKRDFGKDFRIVSMYRFNNAAGMMEYVEDGRTDLRLDETIRRQIIGYFNGDNDANSLQSHLEGTFPEHAPSDGALTYLKGKYTPSVYYSLYENAALTKLAFTLHMALGSNMLLEFGEEVAKVDTGFPFILADYPWGDQKTGPGKFGTPNSGMLRHYKQMISLKKKYNNYLQGFYRPLRELGSDQGLFCFAKIKTSKKKDEEAGYQYNSLSCFNKSSESKELSLTLNEELEKWVGKKGLTDIYSGRSFQPKDGNVSITIPATGAITLIVL